MKTDKELIQQALHALELIDEAMPFPVAKLTIKNLRDRLAQPEQEPVSMRMPKVGDKIICLEDDSLATVVSLTAGGSPDIVFSDGSRGTYLLREFAELFGYVAAPQPAEQEPYGWVRPNTSFNSGAFNLGAQCPPGWEGSAVAVFKQIAPASAQPAQQEPVGYEHHVYAPYGAPGEVRIRVVLASQYKLPNGSISGDFQWLIDEYRADPNTIKLVPLYKENL